MNKHTHEDGIPFTKEEFLKKLETDNEFNEEFGNKGIDQISDLIKQLKENPDSRRLIVNAWAVDDLLEMVLPPCHYVFQMYTRELSYNERDQLALSYPHIRELCDVNGPMTPKGWDDYNIPTRAISLMWNQRSVDIFLGLPFNIASYGLLLELIAKVVNMIPDQLIGNLGDVHLYNNHIEQAKEQISREPFELPKLNINTEFWPTESGSCGEGLLDARAVFDSFMGDNFCKCLLEEDIQLYDYQSHPSIKAPLSN
jgi:thymidylate synthase